MPVRSLSSSVFRWPDSGKVCEAFARWADKVSRQRPEVLRIGCFGSYARGDWGVGSDLDIVIVIQNTDQPFETRPSGFDTTELPVPADLLVYTHDEWKALEQRRPTPAFLRELRWVYRVEEMTRR